MTLVAMIMFLFFSHCGKKRNILFLHLSIILTFSWQKLQFPSLSTSLRIFWKLIISDKYTGCQKNGLFILKKMGKFGTIFVEHPVAQNLSLNRKPSTYFIKVFIIFLFQDDIALVICMIIWMTVTAGVVMFKVNHFKSIFPLSEP